MKDACDSIKSPRMTRNQVIDQLSLLSDVHVDVVTIHTSGDSGEMWKVQNKEGASGFTEG